MKAALCYLIVGFVFGASMWLASPTITGNREPWDSHGAYFFVALAACGVILPIMNRRWFGLGLVGLYFGQLLVMFVRPQNGMETVPWWRSAILLAVFSLMAVGTALATAWVSRTLACRGRA